MRSSRSAMPDRCIRLCSTPSRKCSIGSRKISASIPLQPATLWPWRCATTRPMCYIPPIRSLAASPKVRCQKTPDAVCITMWQALAAFLGTAHFRSNPQMVQQSSCPECHFQSPPDKDATHFRPLARSTALANRHERENAESARVIFRLVIRAVLSVVQGWRQIFKTAKLGACGLTLARKIRPRRSVQPL